MIEDHILEALRQQVAPDYDLLGPMGGSDVRIAVLAREKSSGGLVVFRLDREKGDDEEDEFDLHVLRQLDASVPYGDAVCPKCGRRGNVWGADCPSCHAALSGSNSALGGLSSEELLELVRDAASGQYEVLGEIRTDLEGAPIFFARDRAGELTGLALWADQDADDAEFQLVVVWSPETGKPRPAPPQKSQAQKVRSDRPTTEPPPPPPLATAEIQSRPAAPPPLKEPWYEEEPPGGSKRGLLIGGAALGLLAIGVLVFGPFGGFGSSAPPVLSEERPPPSQLGSEGLPEDTVPQVSLEPEGGELGEEPEEAAPEPAQTNGTVLIVGDFPQGTRISVNGRQATGTTLQRPPGTYTVAVVAPGHYPATAELAFEAGVRQRWTPELRRVRVETPAPRPQVEEEPEPEPDPPAPEPEPEVSADPGPAIAGALEQYRAALASHDMERLRDAFFGIPSSEEERWEPFFRQFTDGRFSDLEVALASEEPRISQGDRAEVDFSITLSYVDPNGAPPGRPIPLRAVLRGTDQGWLLIRIDPGS